MEPAFSMNFACLRATTINKPAKTRSSIWKHTNMLQIPALRKPHHGALKRDVKNVRPFRRTKSCPDHSWLSDCAFTGIFHKSATAFWAIWVPECLKTIKAIKVYIVIDAYILVCFLSRTRHLSQFCCCFTHAVIFLSGKYRASCSSRRSSRRWRTRRPSPWRRSTGMTWRRSWRSCSAYATSSARRSRIQLPSSITASCKRPASASKL